MEVKLNEVLTTHLADYNANSNLSSATGRRVARDTTIAPTAVVTAARYPLGKVYEMIPYDIIPEANQQWAVASINNSGCADRIRVWKDAKDQIIAFISYYESVWYSFWIAPKNSNHEYFYGTTVMMRDTDTVLSKVFPYARNRILKPASSPNTNEFFGWKKSGLRSEDMTQVKIGRANWLRTSIKIDKQLVTEGFNPSPWLKPHEVGYSYEKNKNCRAVEALVLTQLKQSIDIPIWTDVGGSSHLLNRLAGDNNSIWYCLQKQTLRGGRTGQNYIFKATTVPFVAFENSLEWWTTYFQLSDFKYIDKAFLQKPAVRKRILNAIQLTEQAFVNANSSDRTLWNTKYVAAPIGCLYYWFCWCNFIYSIWPECPQDHLVNNYDLLQEVTLSSMPSTPATKMWLQDTMPVASFFQILKRAVEEHKADPDYPKYSRTEDECRSVVSYKPMMLVDTLNALSDVIKSGVVPSKPTRWRIQEWHDQIVAQSWKIKNVNLDLPQDMFPKPVHITIEDRKYCFIQPISSHQLAEWGSAARNCVGSSSYAQKIKNKQHFILMIMLDNKPRFTAQLNLRGVTLDVSQIKDIANRNLNDAQKKEIEIALSQALEQRSQELVKPES